MNRRGFLRRLAAVPLLAAVPALALTPAPEKPRSPYGPVTTYDAQAAPEERVFLVDEYGYKERYAEWTLTPSEWGIATILGDRYRERRA